MPAEYLVLKLNPLSDLGESSALIKRSTTVTAPLLLEFPLTHWSLLHVHSTIVAFDQK